MPFVITKTKTQELDYEGAPTTDEYVYEGNGRYPDRATSSSARSSPGGSAT